MSFSLGLSVAPVVASCTAAIMQEGLGGNGNLAEGRLFDRQL